MHVQVMLEILNILSKYPGSGYLEPSYDEIRININPENVTPEDEEKLRELGCYPCYDHNEDYPYFVV